MKTKLFCLLALVASLRLFAEPPAPAPTPDAVLKWDADSKSYAAKTGEAEAPFTFAVTNISNAEVAINGLHPSCGCTTAQLPTTPYKLAPGSNVTIKVSMTLAGKMGALTKSVTVDTSAGPKTLLVNVNIPTETKTETK
jgi:hypothetical protein